MTVASASLPDSSRFPGRVVVLAVVAVAVGLVLAERLYRVFEVQLAGAILRVVTTSGVFVASERETVYFGLSGDAPLGLRMTPECSSVFMLLPLFLVTAVMVYFRPGNAKRIFSSLVVSAIVVILVNQARMLAIVGLVNRFGVDEGYYWGHTLLGSMVSVLGGAIALVLFAWSSTRRPRADREAA